MTLHQRPRAHRLAPLLGVALAVAGCGALPLGGDTALSPEAAQAARNTDTAPHRAIGRDRAAALARNGKVFVTYGQSNATSSGALSHQASGRVYMVFEGRAYPYRDPALGGTGPGGSVWGRLGEHLLAEGAPAVFFASAGFGGASMQELAAPPHSDHLRAALIGTQTALGRIDGVLIHQGETNNRAMRGAGNYRAAFEDLLAQIRTVTDAPVYLSLASICANDSDLRLLGLQARIIAATPGVLRGPNTDTLAAPEYRLPDGCHFSSRGLDRFADLWLEALRAASET